MKSFCNIIVGAFKSLKPKDYFIWIGSLLVITVSFLASPKKDVVTLVSSLLGICGVFFVGKGLVLGQFFFVIFSVFYGIVSFKFKYYGEMVTYLGMNTPIAIGSIITWLKHPYEKSVEVEVAHMKPKNFIQLTIFTFAVTALFYFILRLLKTSNLPVSTISIATSSAASYFEIVRSSYYALAFMFNDVVLIVLWTYASVNDFSYFPMIICFVFFFINDLYGFLNWQKMKRFQSREDNNKAC